MRRTTRTVPSRRSTAGKSRAAYSPVDVEVFAGYLRLVAQLPLYTTSILNTLANREKVTLKTGGGVFSHPTAMLGDPTNSNAVKLMCDTSDMAGGSVFFNPGDLPLVTRLGVPIGLGSSFVMGPATAVARVITNDYHSVIVVFNGRILAEDLVFNGAGSFQFDGVNVDDGNVAAVQHSVTSVIITGDGIANVPTDKDWSNDTNFFPNASDGGLALCLPGAKMLIITVEFGGSTSHKVAVRFDQHPAALPLDFSKLSLDGDPATTMTLGGAGDDSVYGNSGLWPFPPFGHAYNLDADLYPGTPALSGTI